MKTLRVHSSVREFRAAQRKLFSTGRRYGQTVVAHARGAKTSAEVEDVEDAMQDAAIEFALAAAAFADSVPVMKTCVKKMRSEA